MNHQNKFVKRLSFTLQRILLEGTLVIVWWHHKKVLRAGGLSFKEFSNKSSELFFECMAMINGEKKIPSALNNFNRA